MIQIEDLSISFHGHPLFEEASFTINPKERCGLVGRNGSGKSTLLRLLVGQEKPDGGSICFSKGYRLGYLDQHIRFSQNTLIAEATLGLPEEEREIPYRAEKMLMGLGFKEQDFESDPRSFSGGYQLRLHLAKVLLSEPDCLLLDEPTNYLDILSIRFLERFLRAWQGELILISHDREFMDRVTTHTLGIHRGKMRKVKGGTVDFFQQILLQEEAHERTRVKQERTRAHLQSFVDRFGAKASKASQAQARKKQLERIPVLEELRSLYDLDFSFRTAPFFGRKMLEAKALNFSFLPEVSLIEELSLTIENGERIAIIGKNGYGKSTILRLLMQELKPQSGEVIQAEKTAIGYFGQTHIQRLSDCKTIEEEIAMSNPQLNFSEIKRIAGLMMFSGDLAKKPVSVLSGGEKSRVLLGKILAKPCNLLFLDEPTHHLDMESIEALIDALEEFEGSFVIVTHSELILKRLNLHKLIVCHQNRQELFLGDYESFLEKQGWEEEGVEKKKKEKVNSQPPRALPDKSRQIAALEKQIVSKEEAKEALLLQLADAAEKGEVARIHSLEKKRLVFEEELLELYEKLDAISEK